MTNVNIYNQSPGESPREWWIVLLLHIFFGYFGVHRFYIGKIGSGVGTLICFFTSWILLFIPSLIWWFIDLILILTAQLKDMEGREIPYSRTPGASQNPTYTATATTEVSSSESNPSGVKFDKKVAEELRELSSLKDEGVITEKEFNKKKRELLDS